MTIPDRPILDLGRGQAAAQGDVVYVARTETDAAFLGKVRSVEYLDGVAWTVCIWDGNRFRQVYAERVRTEIPRTMRRKANEMIEAGR